MARRTTCIACGPISGRMEETRYYRTIKARFPDLALFITDTIQPYQRGQFGLWELSELDRIDKHRLVLPTFSEVHRMGLKLEDESGRHFNVNWFTIAAGYALTQTFAPKGP